MKLKELLEEVFKDGPINQDKLNLSDYCLYGQKDLEDLKDKLLQCEEFSECEELIIMNHPVIVDSSEKILQTQLYRLVEGQKFKGKCYLLSISLSPEMYSPHSIVNTVKDGACISRTIYNSETFEPFKKIVLEFSPERIQNGVDNQEDIVRQELHDLLDKVLDNPKDYEVKGERYVLVRGAFEKNEISKELEKPKFLSGVANIQDPTHRLVYYLDRDIKNNEVSMTLRTKSIPISLSEKFKEELGDKGINITEEEINQFLEKNKV